MTAERDSNGDVKLNFQSPTAQELQKAKYTHIFHYYDQERQLYFPYFDLFSSMGERMNNATSDPNFLEIHLYRCAEGMEFTNKYIYHTNQQLEILTKFFKEVFEDRSFIDGYQPSHKFTQVILPKIIYDQIIVCINEYQLLPIRDLIFEIICIAQKKYVSEVSHWDTPYMQMLVKTAENE